MAEQLGDYIVGTTIETIETEKLITQFEEVIVDDIYGSETPMEQVTVKLHRKLVDIGVQINTLNVENIYNESPQSTSNTTVWLNAPTVPVARPRIVRVSSVCPQSIQITIG